MHLAKGLECRAVAVMACDDEIVPLRSRIETVADETDLEEIYNTGAPSTVCGLHARARPSARDKRRASIRISRRLRD